MKRIRVPAEMLSAANEKRCACVNCLSERAYAVEAVLRYISEHPQVPTDQQINDLWEHWAVPLDPSAKGLGVDGPSRDQIRYTCVEWQRRCFVQEEPEIAEIDATIPDLLFDAPTNVVINEANRHIREAYRRGLRKGEQK